MKIGVISDTHIPERAKEIPEQIISAFKGADLIIHAGDLIAPEVLDSLKKICEVKAVAGNMDSPELLRILKDKEEFNIGNFEIGVAHGRGNPSKLLPLLKEIFPKEKDLIIFGHSHTPFNEKINGTLFFNPGSPTDTIFAPYRSYGIIEIEKEITASIIKMQ